MTYEIDPIEIMWAILKISKPDMVTHTCKSRI